MLKLFTFILLFPICVFAEPVNINEADAETISNALSGIGAKKAEAIVQYRTEHGDFKTMQDLENVSGIGEKTIKANEKDILFSNELGINAKLPSKDEAKPEVDKNTKKDK